MLWIIRHLSEPSVIDLNIKIQPALVLKNECMVLLQHDLDGKRQTSSSGYILGEPTIYYFTSFAMR